MQQHLRGMPADVVTLFRRFVELARKAGPTNLAPVKTRIGLQARTQFAAVTLRRSGLDAHVVLARRLDHPRFRRIEFLPPYNYVHYFRIESLDQLDGQVESWLREASELSQERRLGD